MALKLLEPSVRSRLRSGVAVTCISQCVGELVENSIDASATCVAVRVDIPKFKVQVVDNGKGISLEDLNLAGGRYMTSKCHTIEDVNSKLNFFGYRGEALASITDVSGTVEISSRHRLSQQTYSKIFHNGKAMPVIASKAHRPSVGTTVSVHDFFYNMPVRRRVISPMLELEQVKKAMESIALINPSISFSLRNDSTGECVLQSHKTNSIVSRFGLLFGGDKTIGMKDVFLSQAGFELSGFISIDGHHNKSLQFIYVNGRIVKKTPLHTCVNNVLANSLLSRKFSKAGDSKWRKKDLELGSDFVSPRHTPDVFGVYILQIKCPRSEYDICLEPAKTLIEFKDWGGIMFVIEALLKDFLVRYNLNLGPLSREPEEDQYSPSLMSDSPKVVAQSQQSNTVMDLTLEPFLQSKSVRCPVKLLTSQSLPPAHTCTANEVEDECTGTLQMKVPEKCLIMQDHEFETNTSTPSSYTEWGSEIEGTVQQTSVSLISSKSYSHSVVKDFIEPESRHHHDKISTPVDVESQDCHRFQSSSSFIKPRSLLPKKPSHRNLRKLSDVPLMCTGAVTGSAKCNSAALVSAKPFNTQEQTTTPNTPFRSPLQSSSMSSKLSNLFKNHSHKNSVIPDPSSSFERRLHMIDHHPLSDSHSQVSLALQHKQFGDNVTKNNDSNQPKLSLHNHTDRPLPLDPLTSSLVSVCSYDCINSRLTYNNEKIQSSLTSNVTLSSQTTLTSSSIVNYMPYGQAGKSSVCPININYNLSSIERSLSPLKSHCASVLGTVPCQNQSSALNHNDCVSTACQSDNRTHENKTLKTSSGSTVSCQNVDTTTAKTNQNEAQQVSEDDYNLRVLSYCSNDKTAAVHSEVCSTEHSSMADINCIASIPSLSIPVRAGACESVWKEVVDPVTGGTLYMHSKSGNCVSSLPHDASLDIVVDTVSSSFNKCDGSMLSANGTSPLRHSDMSLASIDTRLAKGLCAPYPFQRLEKYAPKRLSNLGINHGSCTSALLSMDERSSSVSSSLTSFKLQEPLSDTKWRCKSELKEVSSNCCNETHNGLSFMDILRTWKNPTFQGGEGDILRADSRKQNQIKVHSVINRYKFSREMFSNIKVLGQVDNKFIACVLDSCGKGSDLLVMIDQHAAHERVRLEALLEDLYDTSTASAVNDSAIQPQVKSSKIFPPLAIKLQPSEVSLAKLFRDHFKNNGLSLKFEADDQILVTSLPLVFMEREASEVRRGRPTVAPTILKDMIIKQIELLQATCGVASGVPKAIFNVLSSQACHGAIKFGDSLSLTECKSLILSLSQCNLPFQCAHGRPSVVPILDLHILRQRYPKVEATPFPSLRNLGHKISEPTIS